jgi:hypothetical protein
MAMREIISFIASLAGAAVLTALAVLIGPKSPFWRWLLWGGSGILAICAIILLIDILRRRSQKNKNGARPIPDWPIRELFFHISPQVLENNNWQRIGRDLKDKLSTSQLKMWGRKIAPYGRLFSLEEISASYWPGAEFTYAFLAPDKDSEGHSWTPNKAGPVSTDYADLQVNREQALKVCPREESPLEIVFDSANPGRKFWSIEQVRDENGKPTNSFWEYRAVIRNKSAKTVKNVKVTVEAVGALPRRPELSQFDVNKKSVIDLTPNEETLALICRWFNPQRVAGMAIGPNIYGPIKMTASADDVFPVSRLFQFEPDKTPMISDFIAV